MFAFATTIALYLYHFHFMITHLLPSPAPALKGLSFAYRAAGGSPNFGLDFWQFQDNN
jgi:hypothetical protein